MKKSANTTCDTIYTQLMCSERKGKRGGGGERERARREEGGGREGAREDRDDCHELHNDIEGRSRRVLERITYRITHNCSGMHIRFLASIYNKPTVLCPDAFFTRQDLCGLFVSGLQFCQKKRNFISAIPPGQHSA
jgi:hypothetical protein